MLGPGNGTTRGVLFLARCAACSRFLVFLARCAVFFVAGCMLVQLSECCSTFGLLYDSIPLYIIPDFWGLVRCLLRP